MRIGFVVNTIDAQYGLQTGGHLHVFEIAKRTRADEVVLFVPDFAKADVERIVPEARVIAMPSLRRVTSRKLVLFAATLVSWPLRWRELRSCDVLYASSHFLSDTVPAVVARGRRSVVVIFHLVDAPWSRPGNFVVNTIAYVTERLSLLLYRTFGGAIVVVNPGVGEALARMRFENAVVESTCGVAAPSTPIDEDARSTHDVVYLGRLSPTKGLVDLIELWRMVGARVPEARLRIVGDGSPTFVAELRRLVESYDLREKVVLEGRVDDDRKWSILREAALFVFPSKEEGWGIALAEAMTCGAPCVAYDLEPYRYVFPQGLRTAPVGDVARLAAIVTELLLDGAKRRELATAAARLATTFRWDAAMASEARAIAIARSATRR
ncbi:MAG: hypothetical protein NVSMB21_14670 [Vulcanimicrobiaceae bacterium]